MALSDLHSRLEALYGNRKFILIGGPVVILARLGQDLLRCGAERPFLLGSTVGTGALPDPAQAEWHSFEVQASTMMGGFREYEDLLRNPTADARAALDRWDPDRTAAALGAILLSDVPEVAGRRRFAYRPPAWGVFEDKLVVRRVWEGADIAFPPEEIVPADADALAAASARLDRGLGTAWAGDVHEGVHGGAAYTRWVRTEEQCTRATEFFLAHSQRVRVTPFLEGIPCSIHGVVFPDGVAALRPIELLTLRRPDDCELLYAGASTTYDPPDSDREAMREVAGRVGSWLAREVGYRGPFTVDGVLSRDGFLPTELNPRIGAGIYKLAASLADVPLELLLLAVIEGEDVGLTAPEFEELVVGAGDAKRTASALYMLDEPQAETRTRSFRMDGEAWRIVEADEDPDGSLMIGPGPTGGIVLCNWHADRIETGASLAPYVIRALALAEREFGIPVGELVPAREERI